MKVREVIVQLERFDPEAEVVIEGSGGALRISDIGRRERPELGAHPIIYLLDTSDIL